MRRKWLILVITTLVVVVMLLIFKPRKRHESQEPFLQEVKIAYVQFSADLPFFVALEKGFFEQQQLKVIPVKAANSSEMLNALIAGDVQAVAPVGFAAIFGIEQRAPGTIKTYLPGGETEGHNVSNILVRRNSALRFPRELVGKKIGTYTGASQLMNLKLILNSLGIDPIKDVTIVQVAPTLQIQALEAGQFDALFTVEPFTTAALAKGIAQSIIENPRCKYIVDPFVSGACVFTTDFLNKDFGLAQRIYRSMTAGVSFIKSYPGAAKAILPKYTEMTDEILHVTELYAWFPVDETTLDAVQKLADLYVEYGILSRKINIQELFSEENRLSVKNLQGKY